MNSTSLAWCIETQDHSNKSNLVSTVGRLVEYLRLTENNADGYPDNDGSTIATHALNAAKANDKLIIRLQRRVAELERLAETDELTGLFNRRGFDNQLNRALSNASRYDEQGVLIYIDMDNFKPVNDSFGHAAGDEVLRQVASCLSKNIRETDIAGRLGGDEFAVLLTRTNWEDGLSRTEIIEKQLNNVVVNWRGRMIAVTASFGLQGYSAKDVGLNLLDQADEAMYETKRLRADLRDNVRSVRRAAL